MKIILHCQSLPLLINSLTFFKSNQKSNVDTSDSISLYFLSKNICEEFSSINQEINESTKISIEEIFGMEKEK